MKGRLTQSPSVFQCPACLAVVELNCLSCCSSFLENVNSGRNYDEKRVLSLSQGLEYPHSKAAIYSGVGMGWGVQC